MQNSEGDGLFIGARAIRIELEEGVLTGLDELDVPRGEGILAAVMVSGIFEKIGVIEDVSTGASGEIGDGDGVGVDGADDLVIAIEFLAAAFAL